MSPGLYVATSAAMISIGGLVFLYKTLRGEVKPHRISWFFWGAFPLIAFFAQWSESIGSMMWVTLVSGVIPLSVFCASFLNPAAYWQIAPRDYFFGATGVMILVLWYFTQEPTLAIILAISADFAVAIPTIIKTYHYPKTESWVAYGLNTIGFAVALLGVADWTINEASFALYLVMGNVLMTALAMRTIPSRQ